MKIKLNDYTVEDRDLKAANWIEIDSGSQTTYQVDDYSHAIIAIPVGDDTWWDGIEASDIPALDAEGKPCKISISLDVCDNEDSHIFVNGTIEVRHAESEDGEYYYAYTIADLVGHEIGGKMELDYESAADEFISDNPDALYVMDNCRGFANEWTLYVCDSAEEVDEIEARFDDTTEYDSESVRPWLISAMQTDDDYKQDHGCVKCVSAMFWSDHE